MHARAVYNLAIPNAISKPVNRARRSVHYICAVLHLWLAVLGLTLASLAADWNTPEQQLARKIVAVSGPGPVELRVENRSSLGRRDSEIIQNGLRSVLGGLGIRFVKTEQAAAAVIISLAENSTSYVWVAQIQKGENEVQVVMVSAPRPQGSTVGHDAVPLSLRKTSLWTQSDPILDVAVLEESATPTSIAVLDPEKVAIYRLQAGRWQQEQALAIVHARAWPRDLRGRLIPAKDHLLDIYLPGVICHSAGGGPLTLSCSESDDPWPLVPPGLSGVPTVFPSAGMPNGPAASISPVGAFFAPARNFFTGVLTASAGKFTTVPKFYSAALLPRAKNTLWFFAATDGQVHMIDDASDQTTQFTWGSDITTVRTSCGAGWQVLATASGEQSADSVRAYEFPDRDPIAVTAAVDLSGSVTALWTEARGDTAVAVVKNQETGGYEAFRLALACNQ